MNNRDIMRNLYNGGWKTMRADEKKKIKDHAASDTARNSYNFARLMGELVQYTDDATAFEVFNIYIGGKTQGYGAAGYDEGMITKLFEIDKDKLKTILEDNKNERYKKYLFKYSKLSVENEVAGLRSLSKLSACPTFVYEQRVSPSQDALKKLPSVMRLKCLEVLMSDMHISYNIFKNFNDDEFKIMLFGSVLRHRDRVEATWQKYNEIKHMGKVAIVKVKAKCKTCGPWEFQLTSQRARTAAGIKNTQIGYQLLSDWCCLCHKSLGSPPQIIVEDDNG